jgi:putative membrane protein
MAYILLRWLLNALGIMLVTYLIPGISVANFYTALIVALVLGILNALVRPVLIFLTLPINILTLGLFTLVINALILWFVSSFVKGFTVSGFGTAFWGALALWLIGWLTNSLLKETL